MSDVFDQIEASLQGQGKGLFTQQPVGSSFTGTITGITFAQMTEYGTSQPAVFPSGEPKMQYVIRLHVPALTTSEDDGARALYIKAWGAQRSWLQEAIEATGLDVRQALAVGNQITATFAREERVQGKTGTYTQNVYQYVITPAAEANLQQPAPAAPPAQAPQWYAQPAPAQPAPAQPAPAPQQYAQPAPAQQPPAPAPVQQDVASKARELASLGVAHPQIAKHLGTEESAVAVMLGNY
nr:MAG TPA: YenB [Caudoviricetes sp.]